MELSHVKAIDGSFTVLSFHAEAVFIVRALIFLLLVVKMLIIVELNIDLGNEFMSKQTIFFITSPSFFNQFTQRDFLKDVLVQKSAAVTFFAIILKPKHTDLFVLIRVPGTCHSINVLN